LFIITDTETRDEEKHDVISEKLHFHFLVEYAYSKHDRVKTMDTYEKLTPFDKK